MGKYNITSERRYYFTSIIDVVDVSVQYDCLNIAKNPDKRLFNPDGYDDGVNHHWFKNDIIFFNLGFA